MGLSSVLAQTKSGGPAPEVDVKGTEATRLEAPWRVILYNDDIHTFDEVIFQLMKATGCSLPEAETLTWKVHTEGKAAVYEGAFEACFRVQRVLREIQLITEIQG